MTNAVGQGRVFFQLPKELNTQQGYFDLPDAAAGVTFKDGAFLNFDNKQTQIGSREAPVELRLGIHWQHFKFEYFDRWTSSFTNVPQPRSKDAGGAAVQALALEGIGQLVETDTPAIRVEARSVWEVVSGKDTVHCLAWVRRETVKGQPRRDLADRWNGKDDINTAPGTFEIGAPATARGRYVAFLGRGDTKPPPKLGDPLPIGEVRISMIKSGRAFMAGSSAEGFWDLSRLAPDEGRFTAAHETGHIFSQQDEYLNTDDEPSYSQPNIGEKVRSSGAPYGLDRRAMMVNNFEVRARYFWDMLLFARARPLQGREGAVRQARADDVLDGCDASRPEPCSVPSRTAARRGDSTLWVVRSVRVFDRSRRIHVGPGRIGGRQSLRRLRHGARENGVEGAEYLSV